MVVGELFITTLVCEEIWEYLKTNVMNVGL